MASMPEAITKDADDRRKMTGNNEYACYQPGKDD
jgi:hypothetical protein